MELPSSDLILIKRPEAMAATAESHRRGQHVGVQFPGLHDDEFMMYDFKVKPCCIEGCRGVPSECPYVHPGREQGRRDPRRHSYNCFTCEGFLGHGSCPEGDSCEKSHGLLEVQFHPSRYSSVMSKGWLVSDMRWRLKDLMWKEKYGITASAWSESIRHAAEFILSLDARSDDSVSDAWYEPSTRAHTSPLAIELPSSDPILTKRPEAMAATAEGLGKHPREQHTSVHFSDLIQDDEFMMYDFKVKPCCIEGCRGIPSECRYSYSCFRCWAFHFNGSCPEGDACEKAHGLLEAQFHPFRYNWVTKPWLVMRRRLEDRLMWKQEKYGITASAWPESIRPAAVFVLSLESKGAARSDDVILTDGYFGSRVTVDLLDDDEREALEHVLTDARAEPTMLSYDLLRRITDGFSQEIGRGGFGAVYKGSIGRNCKVAVNELLNTEGISEEEFLGELKKCLVRVRHNNIVTLSGYCYNTQRQLSPFNGAHVLAETRGYMPNKSLYHHLKGEFPGREWDKCYLIEGICQGLCYLDIEQRIVHLDLKPENILLDADMVLKITDFGLSRRFGGEQTKMFTKAIYGTPGYIAPEYWNKGEISCKSDIFSLGVIIMELLRGSTDLPDLENPVSKHVKQNAVDATFMKERCCYFPWYHVQFLLRECEEQGRRDLRCYSDSFFKCWAFHFNGSCPEGDACEKAHGLLEVSRCLLFMGAPICLEECMNEKNGITASAWSKSIRPAAELIVNYYLKSKSSQADLYPRVTLPVRGGKSEVTGKQVHYQLSRERFINLLLVKLWLIYHGINDKMIYYLPCISRIGNTYKRHFKLAADAFSVDGRYPFQRTSGYAANIKYNCLKEYKPSEGILEILHGLERHQDSKIDAKVLKEGRRQSPCQEAEMKILHDEDAKESETLQEEDGHRLFIVDSGATVHATGDRALLSGFTAVAAADSRDDAYQARDGRALPVAGVGAVACGQINLCGVRYVSGLQPGLTMVSVQQLVDEQDCLVMFGGGRCQVKHQSTGAIVGKGRLHDDDGLYHLDFLSIVSPPLAD